MHNPNVKTMIGYLRVSTDEQGDNGVGLEAQRRAIEAEAERRGWTLIEVIEDVASGKNLKRPGIRRALAMLAGSEADGMIVAKLDRLGRDVGDFADLLKLSAKQGWALRLLDLDIDTSDEHGRGGGVRRRRLRAGRAQADRRAHPRRARGQAQRRRPARAPGAGKSDALYRRIRRQRSAGWSLQKIADKLNADGVPTHEAAASGGRRKCRPS